MKESDVRINFIAEYISAYEEKIKLLNSSGLFDAAKLFELFATEVGSLYFGQRLSNLNVDTYAYPCVDLISDDKQTYVQVSTVKNIPAKVKATLEKIRDSSRAEIRALANVKFIVLHNDSVDGIKDYSGENQIGDVSFTKTNGLITTRDILEKATNDLDFQIALYELLKKETESIKDNSSKLKEAIENSKSIGLGNIDCKINDEYEIDRQELIDKIKSEDHKNISIQGGAGSGKSVLCKKLVENEVNLVYARAEQFGEKTDINNVWGFNIRQTLEFLNGTPIVFFVDSLEFIADIPTKLDLLGVLYECTKDYPKAKIITSCRTSDKNAFVKIESNYSIRSYEVSELTIAEQSAIANKYPIIKKMLGMNSYAELLKSPFYINLIVSKITDIDSISDENQLREYIWQHIICLNNNKVQQIVESIVFTRAKNFSLGAASSDYDTKTIETLVSESVLVRNGKTVRLKYDIFEDICFEQYLDNEFDKCKGKYDEFFNAIESFGRCIYRRYQIWTSNKLLEKNNREKFLFELVFSEEMPQFWKKQTEIGLVKSRYCDQFFSEYGQTIIENGRLNDFIKVTNLYAFEINNHFPLYIRLHSSGGGRQSLIHLIIEKELYKKDGISQADIEKLCTDYSKVKSKERQAAEEACLILQYIIGKYIDEAEIGELYRLHDIANGLLESVYRMAEFSEEWIKGFWRKLVSFFKSGNRDKERFAADVIEDTLAFKHIELAKHLPAELCTLAEMLWTYSPPRKNELGDFAPYQRDRFDGGAQYGLSENAKHYERGTSQSTAFESNFFFSLFKHNFWIGLNWTIDFINKAILRLAEKQDGGLPNYEINLLDNQKKKSYMGFGEMWLVTTEKHRMPTVISDLLFCLKEVLRSFIKNDVIELDKIAGVAKNVKKHIYEKSNNIALLTVIADIGMEFQEKLPGFALDLATNIDIVNFDSARLQLLKKTPGQKMLEDQIMMIIGIPSSFLPDRYNTKTAKRYSLQTYVVDSQICCCESIQLKCHKILDYLYSIIPNDEEHAVNHLQIQKMDLRTAQIVKVDDTTMELRPTIIGDAEKITTEYEKQRQPESAIISQINAYHKKISDNTFCLEDCIEMIKLVLEAREKTFAPVEYDKFLVALFVEALSNKELDSDARTRFCRMWLDGIRDHFSSGGLIFDYHLSYVLFSQVENNICGEVKKQIKQLIVDLMLFDGHNGVILEVSDSAKRYLATNEWLAIAVFNTIVKLAEDEMNHEKFNARYIAQLGERDNFEFFPNAQPKLKGVDRHIEVNKGEAYQSKKNEIIEEYLFTNTELDLSEFNMDNYDITTLCYAVNCGLTLSNATFANIVKKFIISMIDVLKVTESKHNSYEILGTSLLHVRTFFRNEFIASDTQALVVLDILFEDINFAKFTSEAVEFYLGVFDSLSPEYFDSHSDKARRAKCEKIIRLLEGKIKDVSEENVKVKLYKSLTLSIPAYSQAWSKYPSGYTYQDKQFLNTLFSEYGGFHLKEMFDAIYKLHLGKLLPEVLPGVRDALKHSLQINKSANKAFPRTMKKNKDVALLMITKAFFDFSDQIKQDDGLTKAFEEILEMLIEINYEEAATILDEFRIH